MSELLKPEHQKQIEEIRAVYAAGQTSNFNALVMGEFSSGKSRLLTTGRLPVLVDSFDPRTAVVFSREIAEGKVLLRDYSAETSDAPVMYNKWRAQWEEDLRSGFLGLFGTYSIDSGTNWVNALANQVAKSNSRRVGMLAQGDYPSMYATVRDVVNLTSAQPVDFVMTAHLMLDRDEITGQIIAELAVYKRLRAILPILFSERYIMLKEQGPNGLNYKLLTEDWNWYKAGSRLRNNNPLILAKEEPNIKAILAKAGLSTQDKPLFK
jgi:hypothetical protein